MVEISDREYWRALNYHDGILYCSMLEIGGKDDWRMISRDDWMTDMVGLESEDIRLFKSKIWYYGDTVLYDTPHWVVPVRDV
jgi:hypothetical protein